MFVVTLFDFAHSAGPRHAPFDPALPDCAIKARRKAKRYIQYRHIQPCGEAL